VVRTALYTAIAGGYNELQPVPDISGVDCIAFVEGSEVVDPVGWDVRPVLFALAGESPRRIAKWYKLHPALALPEHDRTLWIDGSVRLDDPFFVDLALTQAEPSGLALWRHPERDNVFDEAVASLRFPKYEAEPMLRQVSSYWESGLRFDSGLWACGVLARHAHPEVDRVFDSWAGEVELWSAQDQLAFPWACAREGFTPGDLVGSIYDNPWVTITGHNQAE
jgi:hypothetical protein